VGPRWPSGAPSAFTNLLQEQIRNGRLTALDSTAAGFRARFPESHDLWEAEWYAAWGQGNLERADSIGRAVFARARTTRQAVRAAMATSALAYLRGRRREGLRWMTSRSEAMLRANPSVANRLAFALDTAIDAAGAGDASRSRAAIERGLARNPVDSIPPSDRPWEELAQLAGAIADPALARLALAGYERDQAPTARDPVGRRAFYSAHVALAERRWAEAIGMLQEADARTTVIQRYAMSQIGRAYDVVGQSDSAIAHYEKFLGTRDAQPEEDARSRAQVYRWLGELYEAEGMSRQAMEQYGRFVALWAEADPELQPQVSEIRARLERLRARAG
jgi:tetratricopeptide (TPR) repeat protein